MNELFETALEEGELITSVSLTAPDRARYQKFPNPASRYAMAGVFLARTADRATVAVTGAGNSGVFQWTAMEETLGRSLDPSAVTDLPDSGIMLGDMHGDASYRAHLIRAMTRKAVAHLTRDRV